MAIRIHFEMVTGPHWKVTWWAGSVHICGVRRTCAGRYDTKSFLNMRLWPTVGKKKKRNINI